MNVTIKDIAAMAGVSVSTVSRALNDKGGMKPETRDRILDIATRLGYRPSAFARGLVLQRTKTVMVLVPDLTNYYFAEVTQEICTACRQRGYKVLLCSTGNQPELEKDYLEFIREGAVDGAIVIPQLDEHNFADYLDLVRAHFPVVLIDRAFDRLKMNSVLVDNEAGGEMVADYLYAKGHTKLAFIGGDVEHVHASRDRYTGFIRGLRKNGLPVIDDYILLDRPSPDPGGVEGTRRLMNMADPPTAVFADNDLTAIACCSTILRGGRHVPDDMAVVGFDNLNISPIFDVPLTTVAQPKRGIAETAVDMTIELIRNRGQNDGKEVNEVLLKPELVVRASA